MKEVEIVMANDQELNEFRFTMDCLISMRNAINQRANSENPYPLLWRLSVPIGVVTGAKLVEHVGDRTDLMITAEVDERVLSSADTEIDLSKYVGAIGFIPQSVSYEEGVAVHKEVALDATGVTPRSKVKFVELPPVRVLANDDHQPSSED